MTFCQNDFAKVHDPTDQRGRRSQTELGSSFRFVLLIGSTYSYLWLLIRTGSNFQRLIDFSKFFVQSLMRLTRSSKERNPNLGSKSLYYEAQTIRKRVLFEHSLDELLSKHAN